MNFTLLFSMIAFAMQELVRTRYDRAFGHDAKESVEYVVFVSSTLVLIFLAFPNWK